MSLWGNIVGMVRGNCAQNDATKPDYIHNKPYVISDSKAKIQMDVSLEGKKLTGVPAPENASEAANKEYVDSRRFAATVAVPASGWSETAPYTQAVAVAGILATDQPHYGPVYSGDSLAQKEAFACIDDLDTGDGTVTFTCFEDRPQADLTIQLEVIR